MHIVDDSEVNRVLSFPVLIEAIEAAHRRPKIAVHDSYLGDDKGQQLVTRSAVDAGRFMMTKLYTSFPGNLAHGKLPAVQAVCVLFDGNDGRPLAVMDAAAISLARENKLPIVVFNIHEPGAFTAVMKGEGRFTTVVEN